MYKLLFSPKLPKGQQQQKKITPENSLTAKKSKQMCPQTRTYRLFFFKTYTSI